MSSFVRIVLCVCVWFLANNSLLKHFVVFWIRDECEHICNRKLRVCIKSNWRIFYHWKMSVVCCYWSCFLLAIENQGICVNLWITNKCNLVLHIEISVKFLENSFNFVPVSLSLHISLSHMLLVCVDSFCEWMVRCGITDFPSSVLQLFGCLFQCFTVEQCGIVVCGIFAFVEIPIKTEHYVEGGRIVRVTSGVSVLRFLLVSTTIWLGTCEKQNNKNT